MVTMSVVQGCGLYTARRKTLAEGYFFPLFLPFTSSPPIKDVREGK